MYNQLDIFGQSTEVFTSLKDQLKNRDIPKDLPLMVSYGGG